MEKDSISVFVDSAVVISSLLSTKGAAHLLTHQAKIQRFISNISHNELDSVIERVGIDKKDLESLLNTKFSIVKLTDRNDTLKENFSNYVTDINDSHIIAGVAASQAKFLLTYNIKHLNQDLIKRDFNVTSLAPAMFLQYLRSLD